MSRVLKGKTIRNLIPQPNKLIKVTRKNDINDENSHNFMCQSNMYYMNNSRQFGKINSNNCNNLTSLNNLKNHCSLTKKQIVTSIEKNQIKVKNVSSANHINIKNYVNNPSQSKLTNINIKGDSLKKDLISSEFSSTHYNSLNNNNNSNIHSFLLNKSNVRSYVSQRGPHSGLRNSTSFGNNNNIYINNTKLSTNVNNNNSSGNINSTAHHNLGSNISSNANNKIITNSNINENKENLNVNNKALLNKLKDHKQLMKTSITCRNQGKIDVKTSVFDEHDKKIKNDNTKIGCNIDKIIQNVNIKNEINIENNKNEKNELSAIKGPIHVTKTNSLSHIKMKSCGNILINKGKLEENNNINLCNNNKENNEKIIIDSKDKKNVGNNNNNDDDNNLKPSKVKTKSISCFSNKNKLEPIVQNKNLKESLNEKSVKQIKKKDNYKKSNEEFLKKDPKFKLKNKYFNIQKLKEYYKINGHLDKYIKKLSGNVQIPYEYFNVIYNNLLVEEFKYSISEKKSKYNYMKSQPGINETMRSILVDWLIDIHHKFKFTDDTLYMTIFIIDRYLSNNNNTNYLKIDKNNLQLLGISSLLISCKHEEIDVPKISDLIYICDNIFNKKDVIDMEFNILSLLNFYLLIPSPIRFFEFLAIHFGFDKKQFFMGKYLMESFLLNIKYIKYNSSLIACACAYIVMKFFKFKQYKESYDKKYYNIDKEDYENMKNNIKINENNNIENNTENNIDKNKYFYSEANVKECAKDICMLVDNIQNTKYKSCFKKFSGDEFEKVSILICKNSK